MTGDKDKNALTKALKENKNGVEVVFTKVDGTRREMLCSLNSKLLPPVPERTPEEQKKAAAAASKKKKENNPDLFAVYDLEKKRWGSFKYSNLISYQET